MSDGELDNVLDCTKRFAERTAKALSEQMKREKREKLLEHYRIKDPNEPPRPPESIPDSERVVTFDYLRAVVNAADKNTKMLATDLDGLRASHNALARYATKLHETVGKLFGLNHNLIVELSKSGIELSTTKTHFFETYKEIKDEVENEGW